MWFLGRGLWINKSVKRIWNVSDGGYGWERGNLCGRFIDLKGENIGGKVMNKIFEGLKILFIFLFRNYFNEGYF